MAASDASGAPANLPSNKRYELLRQLGTRPIPAYAARRRQPENDKRLLVVELLERDKALTVDEAMQFVKSARVLTECKHQSLAGPIDVYIGERDVLVVSDYFDGEKLSSLWAAARSFGEQVPLEISLRVLLDVLDGLGAIHGVKDSSGNPMGLLHGEVSADNILIGLDGIARVLHLCRVPWASLKRKEALPYLAPEILLRENNATQAADVYSCGALLFEALTGKPVIEQDDVSQIIRRLLSGELPKATVPANARWATELVEIAAHALKTDAGNRLASVEEMATAIRAVVGRRLASQQAVAEHIQATSGLRARKRRALLLSEPIPVEQTAAKPGSVAPRAPRAAAPPPPAIGKSVLTPPPGVARLPSAPPAPVIAAPAAASSSPQAEAAPLIETAPRLVVPEAPVAPKPKLGSSRRPALLVVGVASAGVLAALIMAKVLSSGDAPAAPPVQALAAVQTVESPPAAAQAPVVEPHEPAKPVAVAEALDASAGDARAAEEATSDSSDASVSGIEAAPTPQVPVVIRPAPTAPVVRKPPKPKPTYDPMGI